MPANMIKHISLLTLCAAMGIGVMVPLGAAGARADTATLRAIDSRADADTAVIAIEASDVVPFVASQPDPTSFVVELRNVDAEGFANRFSADPRFPVSAVTVESGETPDGMSVARVLMTLTEPVRPRVRSSRNVVLVETSRTAAATAAASAVPAGALSTIHDIRVERRDGTTTLTLVGTGPLMASDVQALPGSNGVAIDLANATSALPRTTAIGQGPVERVHIAANPNAPLLTRVSVDLSQRLPYRVTPSANGHDLSIVFTETQADPMSALRATPPAPAPPVPPAAAVAALAPSPFQTSAPTGSFALQAAPGAQAAPAPAEPAPAGRYSGHAVSLDFQNADLRAVLRTFAEISGLNVVIDPATQGTVDVALRDVPWDQALDIILRANKLGYMVDGSIVRIAPLTVLAEEETQRRKLAEEQALAGELQVFTRALSYAKAEDLKALITDTVLSQRGSIQTDERTNTIIINDLPDRIQRATDLLTELDSPQPQVEIEARIVQTNREFARTLGVEWGVSSRASSALGNNLPFGFPNQGSITGRTGTLQGPPAPDNFADAAANVVGLGVSGASSAIGLALGSVNGAVNLDVALSALEKQGQGRLLSTPRVSTQNNIEAEITQGVQIPIQTVANNTVTVTFKDAALTLKVTPQITASGTVIMRISLENASPDFSRAINGIPPIDTQRAVTQVLVSSGDTTVIGGIYTSREQTTQDRTPGLSRLPLLGWLFKRDDIRDESRELLIFITPKIVKL